MAERTEEQRITELMGMMNITEEEMNTRIEANKHIPLEQRMADLKRQIEEDKQDWDAWLEEEAKEKEREHEFGQKFVDELNEARWRKRQKETEEFVAKVQETTRKMNETFDNIDRTLDRIIDFFSQEDVMIVQMQEKVARHNREVGFSIIRGGKNDR